MPILFLLTAITTEIAETYNTRAEIEPEEWDGIGLQKQDYDSDKLEKSIKEKLSDYQEWLKAELENG